MNKLVMTVSQLNRYVGSLLSGDDKLQNIFLSGNISNISFNSISGHLYFSLKDDDSIIRCVMFSQDAQRLKFLPENNILVLCRGRVMIYEKQGQYQFYVSDMQILNDNTQTVQFELIKRRLEKEGLFDESKKKPLPKFPKKIAVVTSKTGAAIHDILTVINRRYPLCTIIICSILVQGEGAAEDIVKTLIKLYKFSNIDIIIIGRGGGASEDLAAFNDESLARTIAASNIPIISGVGHQTDFTICDLVADFRAATPSAAAEVAVPDIAELKSNIAYLSSSLIYLYKKNINLLEKNLLLLSKNKLISNPKAFFDVLQLKLNNLELRLKNQFKLYVNDYNNRLFANMSVLENLSPLKVLTRGYSVALKEKSAITSVKQLNSGDNFILRFSDGFADCTVNNREELK